MSAFNSHDFANASIEPDAYNNKVTNFGVFATGSLFTAYYSAPNTITLQFTTTDPAFLTAASSTTTKYILSGPSVPSVSSVTFTPGTRFVTLNLSGPLVSTNTYTLGIADWTVLNGEQANFSGLVVDVILPLDLATVGVGISEIINVGTPSVVGAGVAQAVGIEQDIGIGTPVDSTLVAQIGIGVAQGISVGTPNNGVFTNGHGVGIAETISIGTPVASLQLEPTGVGISQIVAVGTPAVDGNPEPFLGVGIQQNIGVGTPVGFGGTVHGVGIQQNIGVGTPVAALLSNKIMVGVGVAETVSFGTPVVTQTSSFHQFSKGVGFVETIGVGTPKITREFFGLIITPDQAELVALLDPMIQAAFLEGTSGGINPNLIDPIPNYTILTTEQMGEARTPFKASFAAFIDSVHFARAWPTTADTATVPLPSRGSADGSLTFVDGMLVSKVDPT